MQFKMLAAALGLIMVTHAAATEFTEDEKKRMPAMRATLIKQCHAIGKETTKKVTEPTVASWVQSIMQSSEYCICTANYVLKNMTPEMLRNDSKADGEEMGRKASANCVLQPIKDTFPEFCNAMFTQLSAPMGAQHPQVIADYCGCIQRDVEQLTPLTYRRFLNDSRSQLAAYKRGEPLPENLQGTFFASMVNCGLSDLQKKFDAAK